MGQTVGDIGKEYFKRMIMTNLKKTDPSLINDNIDDWFKKYSDKSWMLAIKEIRMSLEPSTWKPKEKGKITGVCLGSVDKPNFDDSGHIDGVKENVVSHGILTDDGIIRISDKGTPDIKWGNEYIIDCIIGETQDKKKWYMVNENEAPLFSRSVPDADILKKLNAVVKPISQLEKGEIVAVKVRMTPYVNSLDEDSLFSMNEDGIQLKMRCSGIQYINEVNMKITFFINPQQFGEQHFKGMFSDSFYSQLKTAEKDEEIEGILREWIVPESELETIVIGRVNVKHSDQYGTSYSMSPVYMMMIDDSKFDAESYIQKHIEETPDIIEYPKEHIDHYLHCLEVLSGEATLDKLTGAINVEMKWSDAYIEELTIYLKNAKLITEPILNTLKLVDTVSEPPTDDKELKPMPPELLRLYLTNNQYISVKELKEYGYDVSTVDLTHAYCEIYSETNNTTYSEKELIGLTVIELKDLAVNYNIDTKQMKKKDIIDAIWEAQKDA